MSVDCLAYTFLSKIKEKIVIPCCMQIDPDVIKLKVYFPEPFDDLDLQFLNKIVRDETEHNFSELAELGFDKVFIVIFNGLKVTIKWIK